MTGTSQSTQACPPGAYPTHKPGKRAKKGGQKVRVLRGGLDPNPPEQAVQDVGAWLEYLRRRKAELRSRVCCSEPWVEEVTYRDAAYPPPAHADHPGGPTWDQYDGARKAAAAALASARRAVLAARRSGTARHRALAAELLAEALAMAAAAASRRPPGMVRCRSCRRWTPPACVGSSGHCDECRVEAMDHAFMARLPSSRSGHAFSAIRAAVEAGRLGEDQVKGAVGDGAK